MAPACWSHSAAKADGDDRLTVEEARAYLLELINRDRAALGRKPVLMERGAAMQMGQQQSEQMVRLAAMSHSDVEGRMPVQRYTEAGGRDRVSENVVLMSVRRQLDEPIELDPQPTFTRAEIESLEAAYFNEVPPNDGHRRNILRPEHTHVGIGLARGGGLDDRIIGNAEEFVDRYAEELDPIPAEAKAGESITVGGRLPRERRVAAVGVARGVLPKPLDRDQFQAIGHYYVPAPYVKYRADEPREEAKYRLQADGRFQVTVPLNDGGRPGLYYIFLWVRDPDRGELLSSVRTVAVKPAAALTGDAKP